MIILIHKYGMPPILIIVVQDHLRPIPQPSQHRLIRRNIPDRVHLLRLYRPADAAALNHNDVFDGQNEVGGDVGGFEVDAVDEHHMREFAVAVQELHDFGVHLAVFFEVADFLVEDPHTAAPVLVGSVVLRGHHVLGAFEDVPETVQHPRHWLDYQSR